MNDNPTHSAIVVGAGISGLSAALALHRAGVAVTVLEQSERVGGVIQSKLEKGYLTESGPNSYTSTGEAINRQVESLNLQPIAVNREVAKKRYLVHHGELQALPDGPASFLTTPLLSWRGKGRLLSEPFRPRVQHQDPTLAQFIRHRLGSEVLERFVNPFVSGVYAGNPEELSARSVFPKLFEWEQQHGSLLQGALASRKNAAEPNKVPYALFSFPSGMQALMQAIADELPPGSIRLSTQVTRIEPLAEGRYRVCMGEQDASLTSALILATPANVTSGLLGGLSLASKQALNAIPYAAMNVLHTGFRREDIPHALDGFGFLIPRAEKITLLGTIWASSLFPERAPQGHVLLSHFIGGALHTNLQNWPDKTLIQTVLDDLSHIFKTRLQPDYTRLIRWPRAIPQYTRGHAERVAAIESELTHWAGLQLCGNYLYGVSLNDCVVSGENAAQALLSDLNGSCNV